MTTLDAQLLNFTGDVQQLQAFFAERSEALKDWCTACCDSLRLVQLFPREPQVDNRELARTAARAIGGKWSRRIEKDGESWEGNIVLGGGCAVKVILHYVIKRDERDILQPINLEAEAAA